MILIFSADANLEIMACRSFRVAKVAARDVRKVTTGMAGLWLHSDVAF